MGKVYGLGWRRSTRPHVWIAVTADLGALVMGGVALLLVLFRITIEWRLAVLPKVAAVQA